MGRARRNQRDESRKRRAAKRRKIHPGNYSDDEIDGFVTIQPQQQQSRNEAPSLKQDDCSDIDTASTSPQDKSETPVSIPHNNKVEQSEAQGPVRPKLDKIQRMRLKKHLQKQRNKEKKKARAAASIAKP